MNLLTTEALLAQHARERPNHPAFTDGTDSLSYAELDARVGRLAAGLAGLGPGAGDAIALRLGDGADWLVACYAGDVAAPAPPSGSA